jgi:hypothetical protein
MGIEIIGAQQTWENWSNNGAGAWRLWFMAPYGQWIYSAWVSNNSVVYKRIDTGTTDQNYSLETWDMSGASSPPSDVFPHETSDFGPDGAIGMACIRGTTPVLYIVGRDNPEPDKDCVIHKFSATTYSSLAASILPLYETAGLRIEIDQICGFEVDSSNAFYIVTNNRNGREFELRRFAYLFDGSQPDPSHTVTLSDTYIQNNSLSKIRGTALATDGNLLLFANDGLSSSSCKCFKFDKDDLSYLGQTTWTPNLPASTWAYMVQQEQAFLYFSGLDETNLYSWKNAIYYDRATQIASSEHSNIVIDDNVLPFNNDNATEIKYYANDDFGIAVDNISTKFELYDFDEDEPTSWDEETPALADTSLGPFFDVDDVPLQVSVTVTTDGAGLAKAYYMSPREGTGSQRYLIRVTCPAV